MHYYLCLMPEALILSQLSPEEFGRHLATGESKRNSQPAIFIELKVGVEHHGMMAMLYGGFAESVTNCVAHEDGSPKRTVWVSSYRTLELMPSELLGDLYIVTGDGQSLRISPQAECPSLTQKAFCFWELAPRSILSVTRLSPHTFMTEMTETRPFRVPRLAVLHMRLNGLADDPSSEGGDLPYPNMHQIRVALERIRTDRTHPTKTVDRSYNARTFLRVIGSGLYIGEEGKGVIAYYPFPTQEKLNRSHYDWWRSAQRG